MKSNIEPSSAVGICHLRNDKLSLILCGVEIGRITIKDNVLSFDGEVDESAKLFVESVNKILKRN